MIRQTKINCADCTNTACLLHGFPEKHSRQIIDERKTIIHSKKGQQIFIEGMPVSGIYFILSGKVRIHKSGPGGKQQVIRLSKEGDILGHRGIGVRNIYPVGAIALEDTTVCYLETKHFFQILKRDSRLTFQLMLTYAKELQKTENHVRNQAMMSIREKVVYALQMIADLYGITSAGEILGKLSRKDIADIAGTNKEQVSRVITELKNDQIITIEGKHIIINDYKKFNQIIAVFAM